MMLAFSEYDSQANTSLLTPIASTLFGDQSSRLLKKSLEIVGSLIVLKNW